MILTETAKISPARRTALEVLRAVERGVFADRAFAGSAAGLEEADRRLAQELAFGVIRLRGRLDHVIDALVMGGIGRLEAPVLDALRIGAYQLLELDRVPAYAAVSDSVEAAKLSAGTGAASLVNAVLRRLGGATYGSIRFPKLQDDPVGYLSTWGSHPGWLLERWMARWSVEEVERLVEHNNSRPGMYLTVLDELGTAVARLREADVSVSAVHWTRASLRLEAGDPVHALQIVDAVVQDPGAAAVVDYMALDPDTPVVDLCAAPGGKAAVLAARGHEVLACDLSESRLARLLENRGRLRLTRLHVVQADSTRPPVSQAGVVLLDAPCSGTGTFARHPDGKWRLTAADLEVLVGLQGRLLDAAAEVVVPGGWLFYATCSLEREENEGQVEAFLARRPDFEIDPVTDSGVSSDLLDSHGALQVLPQRHGLDGAYAARLRRGDS